MKLVFMNGGLANQLFQYIFLRWLEIKTGEECIIEDSAFCVENPAHNGYELEKLFGIKKTRLSQVVDKDRWQAMMEERKNGKSIPQQLLDNGLQLSMVYEFGRIDFSGNILKIKPRSVDMNVTGNWYFHGYWIFKKYLQEIEEVIRQELVFPAFVDERNPMYAKCIQQTNSVAIHVRRGDMVELGRGMEPAFFKDAIEVMEEKVENAYYFLFSDDLPWCLEHNEEMGLGAIKERVILIEGNHGENAYRDLQLMLDCKHKIISWSSFSLLAAYLNNNPEQIIIKSDWEESSQPNG